MMSRQSPEKPFLFERIKHEFSFFSFCYKTRSEFSWIHKSAKWWNVKFFPRRHSKMKLCREKIVSLKLIFKWHQRFLDLRIKLHLILLSSRNNDFGDWLYEWVKRSLMLSFSVKWRCFVFFWKGKGIVRVSRNDAAIIFFFDNSMSLFLDAYFYPFDKKFNLL